MYCTKSVLQAIKSDLSTLSFRRYGEHKAGAGSVGGVQPDLAAQTPCDEPADAEPESGALYKVVQLYETLEDALRFCGGESTAIPRQDEWYIRYNVLWI